MSVETRPPRPRTGPPGPVLSVRDLHVHLHRGGRAAAALRGVSLDVAPGEIVALVGESGSGKSTLGFAVQGLLAADSSPHVTGSISVDGTELVGAPPAVVRAVRRRSVRAVFQDPMSSLNPTMRIGRQIDEASTPGPGGTSAQEWLERVGVPAPHERVRAFPHQLSGGQRQRVMIAMAMAAGPSLVIADEPTTALDVTVQAQILRLFRELRDTSGTAFVFVTHDLSVAASIADRIVVLYAGRIVEQGPVRAVASAPAHPYTAGLLSARFDLDADKDRPLSTLPGEPPRATDDVRGCPFTNRCPLAVEACDEAPPPLLAVAQHPGTAACIRTDLVTPALWTAGTGTWPGPADADSAAPATVPAVSVTGARKTFPARRGSAPVHALRGVDLRVAAGESVALVGESGSGKSTLLRAVAGLLDLDDGRVERADPAPQMVYQDAGASLTPWLRVGDLVAERLRGTPRGERDERVAEALRRVGLGPEVARLRPGQLSGGQKQRVAVARAVVVPPQLLLCDEPVSAMDVSLAAAILNLLESLRRELRMAMIFVTHDLAAARYVADRIVVMRSGEVVEAGPADEVVTAPRHPYTRELLASRPALDPAEAS